MHEVVEPGVVVVRYGAAAEMAAGRQGPLIAAVEGAAAGGATALVFVIAPDVRAVELAVPAFWLEATRRERLRLAALAVVSRNAGVRLAVVGFGATNAVRGVRLAVKAFDDERAAIAWAAGAVRAQRGAAPA